MATFPTGVDTFILFRGFSETPRPNVQRTPFDTGPPQQAKTADRYLLERPLTYRMVDADKVAFKTWVETQINDGADFFDWTDPLDNTVKLARIVNGAIQYRPLNHTHTYWLVQFSLETWES